MSIGGSNGNGENENRCTDLEVKKAEIASKVALYCLLGTFLAAIFSIVAVTLLFILLIYSEDTKIDGWNIVAIAAILFTTVTFYGAFIFSQSFGLIVRKDSISAKTNGTNT